ncbi:MAG: peptidoglycan DD-metalloendopeptidase family protein [Hyphomicrobiaceae bacterium]|nr:peptidoglycan DD-metalloendopeptidase family protein [Hyphomicrobiaceae bacterium]
MFGLANTNDQANSTSSLSSGTRLGQDMGAPSYRDSRPASSGLAGFGNSDDATSLPGNLNARSSYLPPQTAAPEVRAARYRVIDNSAQPVENNSYGNDNAYGDEANTGANSLQRAPMKPIAEARRSFLPSEPNGYNYNANSARPARRQVARRAVTRRTPVMNERRVARAVSPDGSINVAPGDTLYSIGRRHNVSVMKLMELNNLSDSSLSVGQQIMLPKTAGARVVARRATSTKGRLIAAASSGTYTVRPGENFQAIARKLGVSSSQLADINGITEPGSIRAGEVLILPTVRKALPRKKRVASLGRQHIGRVKSSRRSVVDNRAQDLKVRKVKTRTISLGQKKSTGVTKRKITSVSKTSRKTRTASRKSPSPRKAKGLAAFRWPVRGRIIGKFGPRPDGTNNDGINLAVPSGTRVKAAAEGVVAYAGSELKGYGKLVLIRHANNWVSAYAHNGKLLVKRGDKIKRGQVVARAGASGSVAQPQVHFELRKGSKPVDPLKYMAGS